MAYNRVALHETFVKKVKWKKYGLFLMIFLVLFFLIRYPKVKEKIYYKDINNYVTDQAVVENIICNKEERYIVLWLSEKHELYQYADFKIEGDNYEIIMKNKILSKIEIGDTITYTSAPRMFGNGDFLPIIELWIEGEEVLNKEIGHRNLMKLYNWCCPAN